jgi:hypothetical protein
VQEQCSGLHRNAALSERSVRNTRAAKMRRARRSAREAKRRPHSTGRQAAINTLDISKVLSTAVVIALLVACGGSQLPIVPGAMPQSRTVSTHRDHSGSWMLPEAKSEDLLYVSNGDNSGGGDVTVYSYPKAKYVGMLVGFDNPDGLCVDSVGNVFIATLNGREVFEYRHGGTKPIEVLETEGQQAVGCAVDPITGNLAVAVLGESPVSHVAVYRNARGKPKFYVFAPLGDAYYCSYDDAGNLFVDGLSYYSFNDHFALGELLRGAHRFRSINLNGAIASPGQVQWYRNYLAVTDQAKAVVDHVRVERDVGAIKGQTQLDDASLGGFWIRGNRLINPDDANKDVEIFAYPSGGSSGRDITEHIGLPNAAVISARPLK